MDVSAAGLQRIIQNRKVMTILIIRVSGLWWLGQSRIHSTKHEVCWHGGIGRGEVAGRAAEIFKNTEARVQTDHTTHAGGKVQTSSRHRLERVVRLCT